MNKGFTVQDSAGRASEARIIAAARSRCEQFGYAKASMQEIAADGARSAANLYRLSSGKLALGGAGRHGDQRGH